MSTSSVALETVAKALRRNNMEVVCVGTAAEVVPALRAFVKAGDSVAVGGSRSLDEAGVMDFLRSGEVRFLDRYAAGLTPREFVRV